MDIIVEKSVELGVDKIIPVITERTIPDIIDKSDKKVERWSKIAIASSKQCGRVKLPEVLHIVDFEEALQAAGKSFEVQLQPDVGHSGVKQQRMMEFFIENLIQYPERIRAGYTPKAVP